MCHRRGQSPTSPVVKFDIRDNICLAVGGFKHGEVVMYAGTKYAVVGVHQSYEDLWAWQIVTLVLIPFNLSGWRLVDRSRVIVLYNLGR